MKVVLDVLLLQERWTFWISYVLARQTSRTLRTRAKKDDGEFMSVTDDVQAASSKSNGNVRAGRARSG